MRFWSALLAATLFIVLGVGFVTVEMPRWTLAAAEAKWRYEIQPGDILFQDLDCGPRCELIRAVTKSRYTHTGIVLEERGERVVWEAYGPVGPTPLAEWLRRGVEGKIAIYKLRPSLQTKLPLIAAEVRALRGLPYDANYQWDDANIYCSELIAKAVNRAAERGVFIPRPVGDLGGNEALVAQWSSGTISARTLVVSPHDLVRSGVLARIVDELQPTVAAQR